MLFDQEEDEVLFQEDEILLQEEILSEKDINEVPHINEEESCINEEELRINEEEPHINEEELRINEELRRNEEEQNIQDENKADESVLSTLDENKKGSNVWNHFDKFKDEKGVIWAKCRYCSGGKYNMGKGSSTGNLNRHLKLHPNKIDPPTMKQVELMNNFLREDNQRLIFTNEIFREKLATWIAADDLPFTTVESPEFGYLINICNPSAR
ncbi:zinc finger BED domain-containing protein RICESLEEPER 3-like [Rhizophagus irregularis DAOM 181602=DAOM 197198]|nr:zinc finger BED domain-containing protein RICESLEEPER 3-like [Rhizophagus irregularis DAOM 181602=DAOM 197198]